MQTKAIDFLNNLNNVDLARLNLALNHVSEQMQNERIALIQSALDIKAYDSFRYVDWNFFNCFSEWHNAEMMSLALSISKIRLCAPKPNKNCANARFAARFGLPPRIQLQKMKLNRYEQQERNGKIFTAYRAVLNSILSRQATEGEIFGYEEIKTGSL